MSIAPNKPFNFYGDTIASSYENQRKNDSWWIWENEKLADFLSSIKENEYLLDAPSGTGRIFNFLIRYKTQNQQNSTRFFLMVRLA
jgi:hypothetical protein